MDADQVDLFVRPAEPNHDNSLVTATLPAYIDPSSGDLFVTISENA